jgi:hypothetical protein
MLHVYNIIIIIRNRTLWKLPNLFWLVGSTCKIFNVPVLWIRLELRTFLVYNLQLLIFIVYPGYLEYQLI